MNDGTLFNAGKSEFYTQQKLYGCKLERIAKRSIKMEKIEHESMSVGNFPKIIVLLMSDSS